jgi:hypothetical protein
MVSVEQEGKAVEVARAGVTESAFHVLRAEKVQAKRVI